MLVELRVKEWTTFRTWKPIDAIITALYYNMTSSLKHLDSGCSSWNDFVLLVLKLS